MYTRVITIFRLERVVELYSTNTQLTTVKGHTGETCVYSLVEAAYV